MRPLVHLLGQCELTVAGAPVPFQIRRKLWHVIGLVATAPNCEIGRTELTEAAWPLSDVNSRNALLHMWRRSIVDASAPFLNGTLVNIDENHVSIDTTCVGIDYQDCCDLAKVALASDDADVVLEAGRAFDALAEDKLLLPSFPSAFVEIRRQFDIQRKAVLRRAWQAEAHLHPEPQALVSVFEERLRSLGDMNGIGNSTIPFTPLPGSTPVKKVNLPTGAQVTAATIIGLLIMAPIVHVLIDTPRKANYPKALSGSVNKPLSDLSRNVIFQLGARDIKQSLATAICTDPSGNIIAAGMATTTNGDHQSITVMLTKSGKVRWVTRQSDANGITTTPKQIFMAESGRIYVASKLTAQRGNARNLAPGRYLSVDVYSRDGTHSFERVHPVAIDAAGTLPIRLISDQKGGVYAFGSSATTQSTEIMHITSGSATDAAPQLIGFPKNFRLTDAIADANGGIFLLGYVPVKTLDGSRHDWHVQAFDKDAKRVWSRNVTGAPGLASTNVRGLINALGQLVTYGPRPTPNKRNKGRLVASLVTMSASTGDVILMDRFDSENQDMDFALCCLPVGKSALMGITTQSPIGSESMTLHRFGNAATDTSLTLTMGLPYNQRVESILSLYIDGNAAVNMLFRPSKQAGSNVALTYVRKYFGREVSTGSLTTAVPFAYTTGDAGYVAGHYNNTFSVYYFGLLP